MQNDTLDTLGHIQTEGSRAFNHSVLGRSLSRLGRGREEAVHDHFGHVEQLIERARVRLNQVFRSGFALKDSADHLGLRVGGGRFEVLGSLLGLVERHYGFLIERELLVEGDNERKSHHLAGGFGSLQASLMRK